MRKLIWILLISIPIWGLSQQTPKVKISVFQNGSFKILKLQGDSITARNELINLIADYQSKGFIATSLDSISIQNNQLIYHLTTGKKYQWVYLHPGNLPNELFKKVSYKERLFKSRIYKQTQIEELFKNLLNHSVNNGYPFASIYLDSISVSGSSIGASINYDPGPEILFDSLLLSGSDHVKSRFLESYLDIRFHSPYNENAFNDIDPKINKLPYIELLSPPQISFQNLGATIALEVKKVNASSADGIIGFLPNQNKEGALLVTGQLDIDLKNLFSSGKELEFYWQRIDEESQQLDLKYLHRNLFKSPLDVTGEFHFLKQDTSYVNLQANFELIYEKASQSFNFYSSFNSSRLSNTNQFVSDTELPNVADLNLNYYGIKVELSNLNNYYKPDRGQSFRADFAVGQKNIRPISSLDQSIYEGIDLNSIQYKLFGKAGNFSQISSRHILYIGTEGGKIFNQSLFMNDAYRIGGLNSIRGFNQNFFFASAYIIGTVEWRIKFENHSFFYLFYDQAYFESKLQSTYTSDLPAGVGLGLDLNTGQGLLKLVIAIGSTKSDKFDISQAKVHLGYNVRF